MIKNSYVIIHYNTNQKYKTNNHINSGEERQRFLADEFQNFLPSVDFDSCTRETKSFLISEKYLLNALNVNNISNMSVSVSGLD